MSRKITPAASCNWNLGRRAIKQAELGERAFCGTTNHLENIFGGIAGGDGGGS